MPRLLRGSFRRSLEIRHGHAAALFSLSLWKQLPDRSALVAFMRGHLHSGAVRVTIGPSSLFYRFALSYGGACTFFCRDQWNQYKCLVGWIHFDGGSFLALLSSQLLTVTGRTPAVAEEEPVDQVHQVDDRSLIERRRFRLRKLPN